MRVTGKVGRNVPWPCLHSPLLGFEGCMPGAVSGPPEMKEVAPRQGAMETPGWAGGGLAPEHAGSNSHSQLPGLFKKEGGTLLL